MPKVRLPDGKVLEVASGSRVADVALKIGPRLAKAAVAARLDGKSVDLAARIPDEGEPVLEILTDKSDAALEILRHSIAHVMAQAVGRLYPGTKFAIGPAIENGFYYDFELPAKLTDTDLARIEEEMRRVIGEQLPFERRDLSIDEARKLMAEAGQSYKVEMIDDLAHPVEPGIAAATSVSIYRDGEFVDLCRGPHIPDTSRAAVFAQMA